MNASKHASRKSKTASRGVRGPNRRRAAGPAILFDLDGTLVDAVYDHVLAWKEALEHKGILLPAWKIHRQIGLSGKSFLPILLREIRRERTPDQIQELEDLHLQIYMRRLPGIRLLPGARELLQRLTEIGIPWAIGTSSEPKASEPLLKQLHVPRSAPVILAKKIARGKPNPDVFIVGARKLGVSLSDSLVVGDSVWDLLAAQRAKALGVGLLCGGYGQSELECAGAFRIYQDPADLLNHLEELGIRRDGK
jgi:HAD superfamily hydrolase (TIGR01509 family)